MSFHEVLAELPRLTFEERQILIRMALELDESPLSAADEKLVQDRLGEHHDNPDSSLPLHELKTVCNHDRCKPSIRKSLRVLRSQLTFLPQENG